MACPGTADDFEEDQFGDDAAAAWYAQAAEEDDGEEEEEESEEEAAFEKDVPEAVPDAAEDPYLAVESDPYGAAQADPYGAGEDVAVAVEEVTTTTTTTTTITKKTKAVKESPVLEAAPPAATEVSPAAPKLSGSGSAESVATATALAAAFAVPAAPQAGSAPADPVTPANSRRLRRTAAAAMPGEEVAPWRQPQRKVQKTHSQFVSASVPPPAPPMPTLSPQQLSPQSPPVSLSPPAVSPDPVPDPVPMPVDDTVDEATADVDMPVDAEGDVAEEDEEQPGGEDMSWDERCVVVRQGQVHIELQHRSPPMGDPALLRFCDWLDKQMPLVVENFPYVQKSGAYVDLSDNVIGPEGLDKLFRVLRDHKVPCVVMKAYRNVLDDSIVDTLVMYLHTQPESFPMHGIHISHNNITEKGANRLIRAAAQCGHYPRATSRLPLWLRLESNYVTNPQKVVADCLKEDISVCLMKDGLCSRPDCNHMSNVHIQLPYFYNQSRRVAKAAPAPEMLATPPAAQSGDGEPLSPEQAPDWMTLRSVPTGYNLTGIPAPKRQDFRPPAPRVGEPRRPAPQVPKAQSRLMPAQRLERPPMPVMAAAVEAPSWESDLHAMAAPVEPPSLEMDSLGHGGDMPSSVRPKMMAPTAKARGTSPNVSWNNNFFSDEGSNSGAVWGVDASSSFGNGWGNRGKGGSWKQGGGRGKGDAWDGGGGGGWKSSWKDGGKHGDSKGKGKAGGKGKGKGKGKKGDWVGPTLLSKVKRDIELSEKDIQLGFQWMYVGEGSSPRITAVDPGAKIAQIAKAGDSLLRVNGLDSAMFTEKQVTDMLKQRPISLRVGDQ